MANTCWMHTVYPAPSKVLHVSASHLSLLQHSWGRYDNHPVYSWGNRDSENLSDLPKLTQLINGRAGIWTQADWPWRLDPVLPASHVFVDVMWQNLNWDKLSLHFSTLERKGFSCQTSVQIDPQDFALEGHTRKGHCIFWTAQNEWCYSDGVENWPHNYFKNKEIKDRWKIMEQKERKRMWKTRRWIIEGILDVSMLEIFGIKYFICNWLACSYS